MTDGARVLERSEKGIRVARPDETPFTMSLLGHMSILVKRSNVCEAAQMVESLGAGFPELKKQCVTDAREFASAYVFGKTHEMHGERLAEYVQGRFKTSSRITNYVVRQFSRQLCGYAISGDITLLGKALLKTRNTREIIQCVIDRGEILKPAVDASRKAMLDPKISQIIKDLRDVQTGTA